jgi:Ca-activated chloride channel family protein
VSDVTLSGIVNNEIESFSYPDLVFSADNRDESGPLSALPRLWATRKIGYLLNQIRLHGPEGEIIDQIVRLSIRYGIVTPYTSYLVTEPAPLGAAEQERIAGEQMEDMEAAPAAPTFGKNAVEKAAEQGAMEEAESVAGPPAEAVDVVRIVGSRTFVYTGDAWVDTSFDPDVMQTVKVNFLSEDYFALTQTSFELAAAFAMGPEVIALYDGVVYEVVAEDVPTEPIQVPAQPTEEATPVIEEPVIVGIPTEEPASEPGSPPSTPVPCLGGMLPLLLVPLAGVVVVVRKRLT